jgi:hypothetical protein
MVVGNSSEIFCPIMIKIIELLGVREAFGVA